MNRFTIMFFMNFISFQFVTAQTNDLQKQIDDQVWKPFVRSFNNRDDEVFKAVHSKDLTRVEQDDNNVLGYDQYFQKVPDSVKAKWGNWKRNIELRFIQRLAGNDRAFEVGYYKTTSTQASTGKSRTNYGKFHVLMRKENGTWKILMDADANEGTTEVIFQTGQPLE